MALGRFARLVGIGLAVTIVLVALIVAAANFPPIFVWQARRDNRSEDREVHMSFPCSGLLYAQASPPKVFRGAWEQVRI
jgi:hypothetical protein